VAVVMAPGLRFDSPAARAALRWLAWIAAALGAFTILLLVEGKNPAVAFFDIVQNTLGSRYGLSEVVVKMSPLLLVALAVTIPARVGLVNVGGEGQMFIGAMCASWAALSFTRLPAWLLLPLMVLLGFVGGGLWAGVAGFLRARGWLTEVFSTMLLNYLGILVVSVLVFGPWRDPTSSNYPQSREFVHAARLPSFGGTRMHLGIVFGVVALVLFDLFLTRTRWGLEMRAIGGNPNAAARSGIPVLRYMVLAMVVGGGLAGIAGMAQVSAIQFRLNPGVSAGFGYVGFLISWLAGHRPRALIPVVFLLAVLAAGGDILQITQGIPYAAVNVLMALILIAVLAARAVRRGVAT
jgi:general nucleoside transport system permease protein